MKKKKAKFDDGQLFNLAMIGPHNLMPLCQGLTDGSHWATLPGEMEEDSFRNAFLFSS